MSVHLQTLEKVQNQALRIITGAMKTTPIDKMQQVTGIPPLSKRRECKAMVQDIKYQCIPDHQMNARMKQLSSGRLKRSSFATETRALKREHQAKMPELVHPSHFSLKGPPWKNNLENVSIQTTVPHLTTKDEQSDVQKKALTLAMLDERYPQEAWMRVFTDGSATDAVKRGGAGVYIQHPSGEWQAEAIPTGLHCTNYRAEVEALIHAANTISSKWVPSRCGIEGNEQADKMAKLGAEDEQEESPVSSTEMKTIIKSLLKTPPTHDSYQQLSRPKQAKFETVS
ncbi:uncharacterized protein [Littorina saxatilis]|uniref:uncharacterized protein n=1 Tax=Littorina saxatilis TaxID=31220 RepID=UPI0038B68C32